jgi:hypothetical protein
MSRVVWRQVAECVNKKRDTAVGYLPRQLQVLLLLHQHEANIKTEDVICRYQSEIIYE